MPTRDSLKGPERLGRRSLELDAVYCAGAGVITVLARRRVGEIIGVAPSLVGTAGVATLVWAGGVAAASRRRRWRGPVAAIAVANVVASTALAAGAVHEERGSGRVLLAVVSAQVASFAAVQTWALSR